MATIVLQAVGGYLGAGIGAGIGAAMGQAAGAIAGYALDQKLFGKDEAINGPRLDGSRFLSSSNGAPIPKAYGRAQIGGQIIWATHFEEVASQRKRGGKGGRSGTITEFSYFVNFAVGICAGPVSKIGRIWADGKELDLKKFKYRTYKGTQDQLPDPLIEALQSSGNTPAYRGLAYVVFEDFPLANYGNRIPQLTFEVIRSVGKLENLIKSVCIIPGSTAFGYSPEKLISNDEDGETTVHNRHSFLAQSDWTASIDELQALCPDLERVSLIVTWFGTDLRASHCRTMPGVERADIHANGHPWNVSGITRDQAHRISHIKGRPAFGSTPTDQSISAAILDLQARGLKVTFYPFLMMDIPHENTLPDPEGKSSQPPYPWRGKITCFPSAGRVGTADQSSRCRQQIAAFAGSSRPESFIQESNILRYAGTGEWSYRRMILHYAHLCVMAGGVESFIIGSELKGLTGIRDETGAFPFVRELMSIADDVRSILGPDCNITYAADWSEYFGYHPQDGSNDVYFNLDPLWASSSIDAIGLDNYMPIADWRSNGDPEDTKANEYDIKYFSRNIAGGEGFDWYYRSHEERQSGRRSPITDGKGEPWIWRFKDLKSWWSNPHHERVNGKRSSVPSAWKPCSKPFWFTELGCPAIDRGPNQPNVFYDAKSSQSSIPYFSMGRRDDLAQRKFLQAHLEFWGEGPQVDKNNPHSTIYTGRMVDFSQISLWAWDARPFPAFPLQNNIWSDGENWIQGHWLNGRLGNCSLDDLVAQILQDYSFSLYDTDALTGWVNGLVIPDRAPARRILEPLLNLFGAGAASDNSKIRFFSGKSNPDAVLNPDQLAEKNNSPVISLYHAQETDLPREAVIYHDEIHDRIESVASKSKRLECQSQRQIRIQLPAILPSEFARHLADCRIRDYWVGRDNLQISLPPQFLQFGPGDTLAINRKYYRGLWQIQTINDGAERNLNLKRIEPPTTKSFPTSMLPKASSPVRDFGKPLALLLDIPQMLTTTSHSPKLIAAITAKPWAGDYAYASSPGKSGFDVRKTSNRRAVIARLTQPLAPGPESRWDYANVLRIMPVYGEFFSKTSLLVLNGDNAAAIQTNDGNWEIIQFRNAVPESDGTYSLSCLLRGQLGTELHMEKGSGAGNYLVLLDQQTETIELTNLEKNLPLNWRVGPTSDAISSDSYREHSFTFTDRAGKPFSPVHIRGTRLPDGNLSINWKRRSRIYGDDWNSPEIPMDEQAEAYRLWIFNKHRIVRQINVTMTKAIYPVEQQIADFTTLPKTVSLKIAQLDAFNNPGSSRSAVLGPL